MSNQDQIKNQKSSNKDSSGDLSIWSVGGIGVVMIIASVAGSALGFRFSKRFMGNEVKSAILKRNPLDKIVKK